MNARERQAYNMGVKAAADVIAASGKGIAAAYPASFRRRELAGLFEQLAREVGSLSLGDDGEPVGPPPDPPSPPPSPATAAVVAPEVVP